MSATEVSHSILQPFIYDLYVCVVKVASSGLIFRESQLHFVLNRIKVNGSKTAEKSCCCILNIEASVLFIGHAGAY